MRIENICIIEPSGYKHSKAFEDVADVMQGGFRDLDYRIPIVYTPTDKSLVFGANIQPSAVPAGAVIFNLEQINTPWMSQEYLALLKQHEVWDYSAINLAGLRKHGIEAKKCGIGYHECIRRLPRNVKPDVDVLFYGSQNEKRRAVWKEIEDAGVRCKWLFGVYGAERDDWIARSKMVLNTPFYDNGIFEIVRCSYLWANSKYVLHEPATLKIAMDDRWRRHMTYSMFRKFEKLRQSTYLKEVL